MTDAAETPSYERDPYLATLRTRLTNAGTDVGRPWVTLADTILYPEGGGQPPDHGSIAGTRVIDVQRAGDEIRHYLERPLSGDVAAERAAVDVELDWVRRYDHMQHHTGQHLLSAIAQDRLGWATTAFHLSSQVCDIELDVEKIGAADLAHLGELVAAEIRAARSVTPRSVSPGGYAALTVRSRGLPDGHRGDIRLVEIAGVDLNTCGGTHLRSTAEIESLHFVGTEPMRGGTRLFFVVGRRARQRMAAHETRAAELRRVVGAGDDEIVAVVTGKLEALRDAGRRERQLEAKLAESVIAALAGRPEPIVAEHWDDLGAGFLQLVARGLADAAPAKAALLTAGAADGAFVIFAGRDSGIDLAVAGPAVAKLLDGRGGGKGTVYQGKAAALGRRTDAARLLATFLPTAGG